MWLVLGGSGFLGPALRQVKAATELVLTHHANPLPGSVPFDARRSSVAELVERAGRRPDAALILLGITNIDACATDPAESARVNVAGIARIVDELRALRIMPVFTSSDAVFDGTQAWWREDDAARPILTYGRQKLEIERHIARLPPPWLIVRLPRLISETYDRRCMVSQWVDALGGEAPIRCATDQFFTPAAALDAARGIAALVESGASGLYHLGGPERLSRRELLQAVLEEYRRHASPKAPVIECLLNELPFAEPRPLDLSMNSERCGAKLRAASEVARLAVQGILQPQ